MSMTRRSLLAGLALTNHQLRGNCTDKCNIFPINKLYKTGTQ